MVVVALILAIMGITLVHDDKYFVDMEYVHFDMEVYLVR